MTLDLQSLIIGAIIGSIISATTVLAIVDFRKVGNIDIEVARLLTKQIREECKDGDRPFRLEGAGAYIAGTCG